MKEAVFLFHYGTKTILEGDTLYASLESLAREAHPNKDVYSIYCSHFLQHLFEEKGVHSFLSLDDFPQKAGEYSCVLCLPSFLTSGSEWGKALALINKQPNAKAVLPLLEKNPKQTAALIVKALHSKKAENKALLFIGHGGAGAQSQGYRSTVEEIKKIFPKAYLVMLEEEGSHAPIFETIREKDILLIPMRLNASPFNTKKIEALISLPLKRLGKTASFLWNRLADIPEFTGLLLE